MDEANNTSTEFGDNFELDVSEETPVEQIETDEIVETETETDSEETETVDEPEETVDTESTDDEPVTLTKAEYAKLMKETENIKKSYDHLRPAYTKATQELSQLRKTTKTELGDETGGASKPTGQTPQNTNTDPRVQIQNMIQQAVAHAVSPLNEQLNAQKDETAITQQLMRLSNNNVEQYNEVSPIMKQVLSEQPKLWDLGTEQAIDVAYQIAENKILKEGLTKVAERTKADTKTNIAMKKANVGNKQRAGQQTERSNLTPEEMVVEGILSTLTKKDAGSVFR